MNQNEFCFYYRMNSANESIFQSLKTTLKTLIIEENADSCPQPTFIDNLGRTTQTLKNQLSYTQNLAEGKQQRISQLEHQLQTLNKEAQQKNRKEIRKYIEMVNEKQVELEKSGRMIHSLKQKIDHLEQQIVEEQSSKSTLETSMNHSIQNFKLTLNQFNSCIDSSELDRIAFEKKYKDLNNKIDQILTINQDLETKKRFLEDEYQTLKQNQRKILNQNTDLQFQKEKLKIQIEQIRKYSSIASKNESSIQSNKLIQKIQSIYDLLMKNSLNYDELNEVKSMDEICAQLATTNKDLKIQLAKKQEIFDKLMIKEDGQYQNKIIEERNPAFFCQLLDKKHQLEEFQRSLQEIERYISSESKSMEEAIFKAECRKQILRQAIKQAEGLKENCNQTDQEIQLLNKKINQYKEQIYEMMENYELKVANKGRVKKKIRCQSCLLGEELAPLLKCNDCFSYFHLKICVSVHECKKKKGSEC